MQRFGGGSFSGEFPQDRQWRSWIRQVIRREPINANDHNMNVARRSRLNRQEGTCQERERERGKNVRTRSAKHCKIRCCISGGGQAFASEIAADASLSKSGKQPRPGQAAALPATESNYPGTGPWDHQEHGHACPQDPCTRRGGHEGPRSGRCGPLFCASIHGGGSWDTSHPPPNAPTSCTVAVNCCRRRLT